MKTIPLEEYKSILLDEIQQLEDIVISFKELKYVLTQSWFERLRNIINDWDNRRLISDGAYDLFEILSNKFQPALLETRLSIVADLARKQNKLRPYRKTRGELASSQINQIRGSIFEINILSALIQACSSIELFPVTGKRKSDVEARIEIEGRSIYVEAKTLGYSKHDGALSLDSKTKQIFDALNGKLAKGRQMYELSVNSPTVLFLSLGFNADKHSINWDIESYFQGRNSNISSIFFFGSPLCRKLMKVFPNKYSSLPLLKKEIMFFQGDFYTNLVNQSIN